jgi:hypothetical protein
MPRKPPRVRIRRPPPRHPAGRAILLTANVNSGSDSDVRFGRASRQLPRQSSRRTLGPMLSTSHRFRFYGNKSRVVGSRSPRPSRWALGMAGRRQAGSLPIFWGKFSRWAGRDSPLRTQRRCRMVNGRRVDGRRRRSRLTVGWTRAGLRRPPATIAHRGPETLRDGRGPNPRQSKAPDAGQRDTLLPILGTDALAQPGPVAARQR